MRKTLFLIAACAVILVLILCAAFWSGRRTGGPMKIAAVFCGFTNDASGAQLAAFRVSNQGGVGAYRWPTYTIEVSGGVSPSFAASFPGGASLPPAQSRIYAVPVPTSAAPWRVVFNFSQESWRRKLTRLPSVARWLVPSSALSFTVTEAISDWVGLGASSPAATGQRQRMAAVFLTRPAILRPQTNGSPSATPISK